MYVIHGPPVFSILGEYASSQPRRSSRISVPSKPSPGASPALPPISCARFQNDVSAASLGAVSEATRLSGAAAASPTSRAMEVVACVSAGY